MNSKWFICISTLLLMACKPTASDGYWFESKQMANTYRKIDIITYDNEKSFEADIQKRNIKRDGKIFGFVVIRPEINECEVHIIDPSVSYAPEQLGHEITHCMYGNFHESQQ